MTDENRQSFDSVVLQLRDEFAADRTRVRQGFLWLISILIFTVLASVVIVLGAGVAMLRQTGKISANMDWADGQMAFHTLQLGTLSNQVAQISRSQLDSSSRLNRLQLSQQQSVDALRNEIERHKRWIDTREMQIGRDSTGLEQRLQQRSAVLDQLAASVARLQDRVDAFVALDGGVVLVGLDPSVGQAEDRVVHTNRQDFAERPLWAALLDSFEVDSLPAVFDAVAEHVDGGNPAPDVSRTISVVPFPNGDRYEGTFQSGLMHGWGIYTKRDGARYEGQYHHDLRHGNGTLVLADGTRYTGGFVRGIRQGLGSLVRPDGSRYVGEFGNDMINGRGIMLYPDDSQYAGDFLNGVRHGHGMHRFANGDMYQGEFRQDLRTGSGIYVFADGSRYEGAFVDGVRHGRGHYRFTDGGEFVGAFRDGAMHGEGLRIVDGRRIRGVWHEGRHVRDLQD